MWGDQEHVKLCVLVVREINVWQHRDTESFRLLSIRSNCFMLVVKLDSTSGHSFGSCRVVVTAQPAQSGSATRSNSCSTASLNTLALNQLVCERYEVQHFVLLAQQEPPQNVRMLQIKLNWTLPVSLWPISCFYPFLQFSFFSLAMHTLHLFKCIFADRIRLDTWSIIIVFSSSNDWCFCFEHMWTAVEKTTWTRWSME